MNRCPECNSIDIIHISQLTGNEEYYLRYLECQTCGNRSRKIMNLNEKEYNEILNKWKGEDNG